MSPEEKSKELIEKYKEYVDCFNMFESFDFEIQLKNAKQSAILCVDEIINALYEYDDRTEDYLKEDFNLDYHSSELQNMDGDFRYWNKVKTELLCL